MPKIKNIIIYVVIAAALVLAYIFFIKAPSSPTATLISSTSGSATPDTAGNGNPSIAQDFLTLLLSVKDIKLDDIIFSGNAFNSLHDSSIYLIH